MEETARAFDLPKFIRQLIQEKRGEEYDEAMTKKEELELSDRLENRIYMVILELMPEESLSEFENLLDGESDEEKIQNFCVQRINGFEELISQELLDFRKAYLETSVI